MIYLIRHGQSEFNAAHKGGDPDPLIFDAPLTELGWAQAQKARHQVATLGIAHVITSPLTRAIQTALLMFDGIAPIKVVATHRELLSHSCDVGRPPSQLQADFPDLSFAHLPEIWWHDGAKNEHGVAVEPRAIFQQRIQQFHRELGEISERPLAVVGHGDTFRELAGVALDNCEIFQLDRGEMSN